MDKPRPVPSDDPPQSELTELRRERARLRIAYMVLYQQFLDLDDYCNSNHYEPTEKDNA